MDQAAPSPPAQSPAAKGRAGRDLPAAIGVGVLLVVVIVASLAFYKALFLVIVAAAIVVGLWELDHALRGRDVQMPMPPLFVGALAMIGGTYYAGPDVLVIALAGTWLAVVLWRMPRGQDGFVQDTTAAVFCSVYTGFLAGFVALLLAEDDGVWRVLTFIAVTIASDIGGYAVGVLAGRHPMAPAISPKKSWEGFAGSTASCMGVGVVCLLFLIQGPWWLGVVLGAIVVVAATLGDLAESLIKRDLGVKDMSDLLPGHGGLMDRLDSLLATVPVVWVVLHFLLPVVAAN